MGDAGTQPPAQDGEIRRGRYVGALYEALQFTVYGPDGSAILLKARVRSQTKITKLLRLLTRRYGLQYHLIACSEGARRFLCDPTFYDNRINDSGDERYVAVPHVQLIVTWDGGHGECLIPLLSTLGDAAAAAGYVRPPGVERFYIGLFGDVVAAPDEVLLPVFREKGLRHGGHVRISNK